MKNPFSKPIRFVAKAVTNMFTKKNKFERPDKRYSTEEKAVPVRRGTSAGHTKGYSSRRPNIQRRLKLKRHRRRMQKESRRINRLAA